MCIFNLLVTLRDKPYWTDEASQVSRDQSTCPRSYTQKMVDTGHYQIPLTPKPLTPKEFKKGKKVPEAVVGRGQGRGLLVEGGLQEEKCWVRRGEWGPGRATTEVRGQMQG